MPIRHEKHITRAMLRAEPDTLWVFGDNLQRRGLGGQAKEMRGEPNAVGIPTKRAPGMHPVDFFTDADLDVYERASEADFARLRTHLSAGGTVVFPDAGLGTGRARLKEAAPQIADALRRDVVKLCEASAEGLFGPSYGLRHDPPEQGTEPVGG